MSSGSEREFSTPMMQQYLRIKAEYPDCLLFFRLGDFYELFLDDALLGAEILNITLTARPRGGDGDIPMAGVPFHAADGYIAKLVRAGHKVAICEQVSDPSAKGLVDRAVVRIITPGTQLSEQAVRATENRYVLSLFEHKNRVGVAWADISTGDFQVAELPLGESLAVALEPELLRFNPAECIVNTAHYERPELLAVLRRHTGLMVYHYPDWDRDARPSAKHVERQFGVQALAGFGITTGSVAHKAASALLGYLKYTQQAEVPQCWELRTYAPEAFVALDQATVANLEVFQSVRGRGQDGTLLQFLAHTKTAGGGRLLRTWLRQPLAELLPIEERLAAVERLVQEKSLRIRLREDLRSVGDIERIVSRLSVGLGTARDLVAMSQSVVAAQRIDELLAAAEQSEFLVNFSALLRDCSVIATVIDEQLLPDPSADIRGGKMFSDGYSAELDELRSMLGGSKAWVKNLETQERERTGIGTLKVRYNKVFGYYIEISRGQLAAVPPEYERKQTLVNAERFITPELKEKEVIILTAQEKAQELEYQLFVELVEQVLAHRQPLLQLAAALSWLDCIAAFAHLAVEQRLVRPQFTTDGSIGIKAGRHPVVEQALGDTLFVPNDTLLNQSDHQLLVLTGPNMAGKSVYMRQVAVVVLLAHIGCFVPAQTAEISLVDRIFVRSGASDAIAGGLSTFMVEMVETAFILQHATERSLVILDEIGRGTSTYDGISIAWAVAEHLTQRHSKTLFATHYHELQQLESEFPKAIRNYHLAVAEHNGEPVFLHTLTEGAASHSYGVAVARLAGVPKGVTERAEELLREMETRNVKV